MTQASAGSQRKNDFGQLLSDAVRENPLPAALVGMGVMWLFMGGGRVTIQEALADSARTGRVGGDGQFAKVGSHLSNSGKQVGHTLLDAGSSAANSISGTAADAASGTTQALSSAADALQRGGGHVVRSLQDDITNMFERQPLALGALGMVVGAAIGSAFASTRVEADAFGEASKTLKKEGEGLLSKGMSAAREAGAALTGSGKEDGSEVASGGVRKAAAVAQSALRTVDEKLRDGSAERVKK